jgi:hypothetical protein
MAVLGGEGGRGFSQDLLLHTQDPVLSAQLDQLLSLGAGQTFLVALVDVGNGQPVAQAALADADVSGDLGAGLGALSCQFGDPETARWASTQGLRASPVQQSLFQVEMRAAAELADFDGVVRAMEAATRAQERVDPECDPPLETVELYREVMGRRPAGAGMSASS